MSLARSYNTVAETSALLAMELPSTDERRTAWDSLSAADKAVVCRQATRDIDACPWRGSVVDSDTTADGIQAGQELMFPRMDHLGVTILPGGELDLPDGVSAWSRASIPGAVRRAAALQAARNAVRARGFDQARQAADMAHVGVASRSGAGRGVTVDVGRATRPWANLDPDAARLLDDLRLKTAEAI